MTPPRPSPTSRILALGAPPTWVDAALSSLRKDWDVEEGMRTWTSEWPDFEEGAHLIPPDVFSALLVFDALPKQLLSPVFRQSFRDYFTRNHHPSGLNYFFVDRALISPGGIAADADTAAMYLTVALEEGLVRRETLGDALETLAHNTDSDGVLQVFLPPRGAREGRRDPVVCANVLSLLYLVEHPGPTRPTEDYLFELLSRREHAQGSLQYTLASTVLYFVCRAVFRFGPERVRARFSELLAACTLEALRPRL